MLERSDALKARVVAAFLKGLRDSVATIHGHQITDMANPRSPLLSRKCLASRQRARASQEACVSAPRSALLRELVGILRAATRKSSGRRACVGDVPGRAAPLKIGGPPPDGAFRRRRHEG
jgi:hypothetical protein